MVNSSEATNRDLLFSQPTEPSLRRRRPQGSRISETSSSNVDDTDAITSSLLRTRAMLSSEVDRVGATARTLEEDSKLMNATANDYGVLSDLSNNARKVLRSLENAKMKEQALLWGAMGFYVCCLLWVIYTRIQGFVLFFAGWF
ncbi:hypothetical protein TrCOL_g2569 [Triparma columacea]|uniref:Sec20 C-terminal domain-containing protein n=1 Tax=Triparma columacea TaxID=722753 RepID=A0A9W7LEI9_9STRA|nr:hypothetical protein TrCOL_g2569 [Triparma columacea]